MKRLRIDGDEWPKLETLPAVEPAPNELVAAVVAAARACGAEADYIELMGRSGEAFALRIGPGFKRLPPDDSALEALRAALGELGFGRARVAAWREGEAPSVLAELRAGRAAVVQGCFPEAPLLCGLIVGAEAEGTWLVLDLTGRVHRIAARGELLIVLGPRGQQRQRDVEELVRRALSCWAAPEAWGRWAEALMAAGDLGKAELEAAVQAHELLYEAAVDARAAGAAWLAELADRAEGISGDWLGEAAALLDSLVALLETRQPAVHSGDVLRAFGEEAWRLEVARLVQRASELDMAAKRAVVNSLEAEFPPGEE